MSGSVLMWFHAVLKRGPKYKADNYRPISLTSTVAKVLESIVRIELLNHLMENDILNYVSAAWICK